MFKGNKSKSEASGHEVEVLGREPGDIAILRCVGLNFSKAEVLSKSNQRIHDIPFNYRDFYQLSIHKLPEGNSGWDAGKYCLVVKVGLGELYYHDFCN